MLREPEKPVSGGPGEATSLLAAAQSGEPDAEQREEWAGPEHPGREPIRKLREDLGLGDR